ncbi:MAG: S8 family serine peptidase [Eubacteriales bacterium]|nr:S8 family serine peptidase [Eubacteriales bacterium]
MKRKGLVIVLVVMLIVALSIGTATADISSTKLTPTPEKVKVLIGFTDMPGSAEEGLVKAFGGEIRYTYTLIPSIAAELPIQAIEALGRNPKINVIELDVKAYEVADEYANAWGIERIGERTAHANGYFGGNAPGNGIKVAVIDSGVDYNHPELVKVYAGGKDFVNKDDDPMDVDGHGTHVAGIIAAELNSVGVVGAASHIQLYALKALEGGSGYFSDIIAALQWCGENGIRITNNSYGSSTDPGTQVKDAFDAAYYSAGILHVASAGNSGNPSGRGDNVGFPGKYASVMAVAASDANDKRASFSSTGPDVEIMAPGVSINSTYLNGSYKLLSGTSMASPHVAGVAAQIWGIDTSMTNIDIRTILKSTTENLGLAVTHQGSGLVRADMATNAVVPSATGIVAGTASDQSTGLAIQGASIEISGTGLFTTSDLDGHYQIANVPIGIYSITATKTGYEAQTKAGEVVSENTTTVCDFILVPVPTYTLNISQVGEGITYPDTGIHEYPAGTVLELNAAPNLGYRFDKWLIDNVEVLSQYANVTMDNNITAVAYFTESTIIPTLSVQTDKYEYSGNTWVYITVRAEDTGSGTANPIPGAAVSARVYPPAGNFSTYSGTTDSTGMVVFKHRLLKTSFKGEYSVVASMEWNGTLLTSETKFIVK